MWDEEIIINNGDLYFQELMQAIEKAQSSIHIEVYIFEYDHIGKKILGLLASAANRNIKVKILLDGFGSANWNLNFTNTWREKGIDIHFFHPLPWQNKAYTIWNFLSLRKIALGYYKFKHRNHRKICIVDGKTLFVSSCNIVEYHLPSIVGKDAWRDTSVKLVGTGVSAYIESFSQAWQVQKNIFGLSWLKQIKNQKKIEHNNIIQRLKLCTKRIWITNPYFVPDLKFIKALCKAAKSGVDVKILLPKDVGLFFYKYAVQAAYTILTTCGIEIYEYKASMLHAKILILDNWVNIGSSNLDFRSIYYNLESNAVIQKPENINLLEEQFLNDLKLSDKIDLNIWRKRSWFIRILERFFLRFRNIL